MATFDIGGYLSSANDNINSEVMWLSEMSKYKSEELELMNVGDFNQKLVYYAHKAEKEKEAYDRAKNGVK